MVVNNAPLLKINQEGLRFTKELVGATTLVAIFVSSVGKTIPNMDREIGTTP